MKNRLDRKVALKLIKEKMKDCLATLEKTAFLFHSYKNEIEEKILDIRFEHLKAMSRKIVESFDQKGEEVQNFVIVYEAVKALATAIDEALKNQSNCRLVSSV